MAKFLKVLSLALVLVMLFSMTTFAAELSDPAHQVDDRARTVKVSGTVSNPADDQQVVILVIKSTANLESVSDSDIAYIDQIGATNGSYEFNFAIDGSKGDKFTAYIGGTAVTTPESLSVSLGSAGPGDIAGNEDGTPDGKVNLDDYMVVINAFGSVFGDARYDERANTFVDKDGVQKINLDDYMVVSNNFGSVY